jgi:multidrug efflux pump subunit AcrA (membrane-fusion protein)
MKHPSGLIALSVAAGVLSACGGSEHAPAAQARAPMAVTAVPVAYADAAERLEAGGVIAAQESALVSSRIVSSIVDVRVRAGDRVHTGDVLVTLDARDVTEHTRQASATALAAEKALAQARAAQTAAEAEQRLAVAWHRRITALHARNSATEQERDEAEARLATAAARVAGAQAALEMVDANLASARAAAEVATTTQSYTTLRAPFDGLITERLTDPANLASPGLPLLRIESSGARQVVVRVDEARAAYVHPRDHVEVSIDGGSPQADAGGIIEGVVTELARAVDADQRAFTVKVALPLIVTARTGTFARVFFRGVSRRQLRVPAAAIQRRGHVTSVFVVQEGLARLRLVQVGTATSTDIEVLAGLDAGESVVASPPPLLLDGSPVTLSGSGPRTGAGQ